MELGALWYISAIVANGAVILVFFYIALLVTVAWLERRRDAREERRRELEKMRYRVGK